MYDKQALLREAVRRHRVCWTTSPLHGVAEGGIRVVGFRIELTGTHAPPHISNACGACMDTLSALRRVAEAVLPPPNPDCLYVLRPFEGLDVTREGDRDPEVHATITVEHRASIDAPPDSCERRCYQHLVATLAMLGAHEGPWVCARSWRTAEQRVAA